MKSGIVTFYVDMLPSGFVYKNVYCVLQYAHVFGAWTALHASYVTGDPIHKYLWSHHKSELYLSQGFVKLHSNSFSCFKPHYRSLLIEHERITESNRRTIYQCDRHAPRGQIRRSSRSKISLGTREIFLARDGLLKAFATSGEGLFARVAIEKWRTPEAGQETLEKPLAPRIFKDLHSALKK